MIFKGKLKPKTFAIFPNLIVDILKQLTSFIFYPFARINSSQFSIIELTEVHKKMIAKKETRIE